MFQVVLKAQNHDRVVTQPLLLKQAPLCILDGPDNFAGSRGMLNVSSSCIISNLLLSGENADVTVTTVEDFQQQLHKCARDATSKTFLKLIRVTCLTDSCRLIYWSLQKISTRLEKAGSLRTGSLSF